MHSSTEDEVTLAEYAYRNNIDLQRSAASISASLVADDPGRLIRLLQVFNLLLCQGNIEATFEQANSVPHSR